MKKKIAFIDLYIDEWHANNYPAWLRQASRGDEFELAYAWEKAPLDGGRNLQQWCREADVSPVESIKEAVDRADCLFVLAPSNPEVHEELAELPLASGKPLFIDKPFAPSLAAAGRIFARAERFHTPLMSCSALRWADELLNGEAKAAVPNFFAVTGGGRSYHEYAIHQLEMIVSVMGTGVEKIIASGRTENAAVILEYADGRRASLAFDTCFPFTVTAAAKDKFFIYRQMSHCFENQISAVLDFFATGQSSVPKEETLAIAGLLEKTVALIEK